ncbi:MAG: hypothetical protein ACK4GM_04550 [Tabrizicola sp.]
MKRWLLIPLFALAACTNPMLATNLTFGTGGVAINPTLSGDIGGATVTIDP